jgi:hypothetical protein
MKLLAFLFVATILLAQPSSPPSVIYVTSDPAGSCSASAQLRFNTSNGKLWGCNALTWGQIGGGGGGSGTVSAATVNQLAYYTAATTVGGNSNLAFYPSALSTPAAPTVTVVGTAGTSTYGYRVAACTPVGCTPTSTEATVATGNAVLDGTNYNHIVTAAISGSTSCQVWLTTDTSNFNEGALVASGNCGDAFDDQGSYPLFVNPGTTDRSRGVSLTTNFLMGGHIGIGSGAALDRFIGSGGFQNAVTVNIVDSVSLDNVIDYGGGAIGINAQLTYTPTGSWNQIWGFNLNPMVGGSGSGSHNFSSIRNSPLYQSADNLSEFDGIIQDLRFQPSGGSANLNSLLGAYLQQMVTTSGTVGTGYGTYVRNDYTNSVITTLAGGWVLHRCTACAITNNYGYYIQAPVVQSGGTVANSFGFYNEDIGPVTGITNPYYEWFDSTGVFRIKEDNSFDSVGQAIAALYNPQFTKYTPGATNFERLIEGRWNGNVAEVGAEKGGTGTLRELRFIGLDVQLPTLAFANLATPSNSAEVYCIDCTVTSGTDNTCAASGGGANAFRINGAWKCVK